MTLRSGRLLRHRRAVRFCFRKDEDSARFDSAGSGSASSDSVGSGSASSDSDGSGSSLAAEIQQPASVPQPVSDSAPTTEVPQTGGVQWSENAQGDGAGGWTLFDISENEWRPVRDGDVAIAEDGGWIVWEDSAWRAVQDGDMALSAEGHWLVWQDGWRILDGSGSLIVQEGQETGAAAGAAGTGLEDKNPEADSPLFVDDGEAADEDETSDEDGDGEAPAEAADESETESPDLFGDGSGIDITETENTAAAETEIEIETEPESITEPESEAESETETERETEPVTEPVTETLITETEVRITEPASETETEKELESETEPSGIETETRVELLTEQETESDLDQIETEEGIEQISDIDSSDTSIVLTDEEGGVEETGDRAEISTEPQNEKVAVSPLTILSVDADDVSTMLPGTVFTITQISGPESERAEDDGCADGIVRNPGSSGIIEEVAPVELAGPVESAADASTASVETGAAADAADPTVAEAAISTAAVTLTTDSYGRLAADGILAAGACYRITEDANPSGYYLSSAARQGVEIQVDLEGKISFCGGSVTQGPFSLLTDAESGSTFIAAANCRSTAFSVTKEADASSSSTITLELFEDAGCQIPVLDASGDARKVTQVIAPGQAVTSEQAFGPDAMPAGGYLKVTEQKQDDLQSVLSYVDSATGETVPLDSSTTLADPGPLDMLTGVNSSAGTITETRSRKALSARVMTASAKASAAASTTAAEAPAAATAATAAEAPAAATAMDAGAGATEAATETDSSADVSGTESADGSVLLRLNRAATAASPIQLTLASADADDPAGSLAIDVGVHTDDTTPWALLAMLIPAGWIFSRLAQRTRDGEDDDD